MVVVATMNVIMGMVNVDMIVTVIVGMISDMGMIIITVIGIMDIVIVPLSVV
jgi:hypothetical protein